jgi:predicted nucleic acid-binding protein
MKITERLQTVTKLFLDTAPVVYYVEEDTRYLALVDPVFDRLDAGTLVAVTSPVTLAECLVMPYRNNQVELQQIFSDLIVNGTNVLFASIDREMGRRAAELRARYNLSLTDAFQIAVALQSGCDAFLTNDMTLKRVSELSVIVLEEMEAEYIPRY